MIDGFRHFDQACRARHGSRRSIGPPWLLAVLLWLGLGGAALAQPVSAVAGQWRGFYVCAQGPTALGLDVTATPSGALHAVFRFSSLPANPNVPSGSFQMDGTYDPATGHVVLTPGAWIARPDGYLTVGLDGTLDCAAGHLRGRVTNGFDCTSFDLARTSHPPSCAPDPAQVASR